MLDQICFLIGKMYWNKGLPRLQKNKNKTFITKKAIA